MLDLTWDYPAEGARAEPDAEAVLAEINGWDADGKPLSAYTAAARTTARPRAAAGSTAASTPTASTRPPGASRAAEQTWVAPEWGWAWPANRRILYNRASADPDGQPWSERKALVWWDEEQGKWTGHDVPDFEKDKSPGYLPPEGATGPGGAGRHRPVHHAGRRQGVAVRAGRAGRRAAAGALRAAGVAGAQPALRAAAQPGRGRRKAIAHPDNRYQPSDGSPGTQVFPYVVTTYRLTEHHTAGGMSRLAAVPGRAAAGAVLRGLAASWPPSAAWRTAAGPRSSPRAPRSRRGCWSPRGCGRCGARASRLHQVGLPYHWGGDGLAPATRSTTCSPIALDPNVHIQESKALDLRHPARPAADAGAARTELVRRVPASGPGSTEQTGTEP